MDPFHNLREMWTNCAFPSVAAVYPLMIHLLAYNVLFNILTQTVVIPTNLFHLISFSLGMTIMILIVAEANIWHCVIFMFCAYLFMWSVYKSNKTLSKYFAFITGFACIGYLLLCEFCHPNRNNWIQARGIFMVASMKIISLSSDVKSESEFPSFFAFFGYTFFPGNSVFGPWIPYKEYIALNEDSRDKNFQWSFKILSTISIAGIFLVFSNCVGSFFFPKKCNKWLLAYNHAQSFRTSHYFISYLSEAAMVTAGYSDDYHNTNELWGYRVTNPVKIEFPSSLVSVVVNWNIPMHTFLKKYIYRPSLQFGQFKAILLTYMVSSLLHGLNVEIAAVLLSIGMYSYVQMKFQDKLSVELNACLGVRKCKSCKHKYKRSALLVRLAHILFSVLTIFNLMFLGVLMNSVGDPDSPSVYAKWSNLDFLGHWVMAGLHIYTII